MTPEERWAKIEQARLELLTAQRDMARAQKDLALAQLEDRSQSASRYADLVEQQTELYKAQAELGKSQKVFIDAVVGLSPRFDRFIELAEKFLSGGFGNGRGGN